MTRFTVATADFRRAIQSAALFAGKDPEVEMWHRVRLDVGPVNVQAWATNGYTAGLSIASVVDNGDGELATFDLAPAQVKDVLHLFPVDRKHAAEQLLEVSLVGDEHVSVRDVSGLFPGKTVELPRLPSLDGEADPVSRIPALLGRTVHAGQKHYLDGVIVTNGEWLALFAHAARIYSDSVCLTPYSEDSGRGRLLATVGDSFIGTLLGRTGDSALVTETVQARDDWKNRLPQVSPHDPAVDLEQALAALADDLNDEENDDE